MKGVSGKLRPLMGKVLSSVADQATSSSTNFAISILLARWLTRTDYGAFSVSWSFCLILAAFHNALILEPLTVIGPAEFGSSFRAYLRVVHKLNWFSVLALGLLSVAAALFYREAEVRWALIAMGLCLPGYLLLLTVRREQYVVNQPIRAFWMSLVYAGTAGGLLAALRASHRVSALTGVFCIGTALPVAVWARSFLAARTPAPRDESIDERAPAPAAIGVVTRAHWTYGRWLFAAAILAVGIPDMQTILLSVMVDLKSAGALRAMMNFILPLSQLLTVLSVFSLPKLARHMKAFGAGRGLRQAIFYPLIMTGAALAYAGILILFGPALERVLYGGRMAAYVVYLRPLALAALISAIGGTFSTLLRAAQNSQHQLFAGIAGTLVGFGAALMLLKPYGLSGAIASMILANSASSAVIVGTYIWMIKTQPASWSHIFHYFTSYFTQEPRREETTTVVTIE